MVSNDVGSTHERSSYETLCNSYRNRFISTGSVMSKT